MEKKEQIKEEPKSRVRFDRLRAIEKEVQATWDAQPEEYLYANVPEDYSNMSFEEKNKEKYMVSFPYPYMNGYLHLGHAFSATKAEYAARYHRQRGRNVLFAQGFHCTGMPIQAAANRLKREIETGKTVSEEPPAPKEDPTAKKGKGKGAKVEAPRRKYTQYEILQQLGIAETEIPAFQSSEKWLDFFPPLGMEDFKAFGMCADWRRSFITTAKNPFYDSFVRWQFNSLKETGKIVYGKRYTIFSERDRQPCADHDRSSGEGVGPQEYVGIKLKVLAVPEALSAFKTKDVYLVAATLRPETMYGQTNCYVLPQGNYGVFEMQDGEYYVMSERAARNFAWQERTKEYGKYPSLASVTGRDLIGVPLRAPLAAYETVYALPMKTISMEKGTGIVTSVPSDSPDDWAALRDLQTKENLRNEFGVKEEWCVPFAPSPIIDVPGLGDLCAVQLVDDLKIKSQGDRDLLATAKETAYKKGFYEGVLKVGVAAGEPVEQAKPKVKAHLLAEKLAVPYYEPEKEVISRSDDACIVASCYQWFLGYGQGDWQAMVREHLKSDRFEAYNPKTQKEFDDMVDWLKEWGCTRTQGLGTKLPWDDKFVIESLSDSTIYMSYYTVAHLLHTDLEGSQPGPLGIKAEDMTHACWDYVLKKGAYPEGCAIAQEHLAKMRHEFEYWYPMDMRVSAKDLIRNHLTMCLYNHAGIWEDEKLLPRSIFCNGYVLLDKRKMSKSEGNFLTLRDAIDLFGVDATRLTLADAGDGLDDANFDREMANQAILKLFTLEEWIKKNVAAACPDGKCDYAAGKASLDLWDRIFEDAINQAIAKTTKFFDEMKFKQALNHAFFNLQIVKEDYLIAKEGKPNPYIVLRFCETQLILMNAITPHFAQYCWRTYICPVLKASPGYDTPLSENLMKMPWPVASGPADKAASSMLKYMKALKSEIRQGWANAQSGGKKKKGKGKADDAAEAPKIEVCNIFCAQEYPVMEQKVLEVLRGFQFEEGEEVDKKDGSVSVVQKIVGDHIAALREAFPDKKQNGLAMKFAAYRLNIAKTEGPEHALQLKSDFDEAAVIGGNRPFLFEGLAAVKTVNVFLNTDEKAVAVADSEKARTDATPSKPSI